MSVSPSEMPQTALHPTGPVPLPTTTDGTSADGPTAGVAPPGVRVQILATEHWSLLATRSMTWSEIMSRITIHLTVASASLVVLALFAQASGFGTEFRVMAIGLAAGVLVLGSLTLLRVVNASNDDAAAVIGMNRLRAAYLELDPGLERYLVTSPHDDQAGLMTTYTMGIRRSTVSHVTASTAFFLTAFNSIVAGCLAALVASALGAGGSGTSVVGVLCGVAYLAIQLEIGRRTFSGQRFDPHFPTPG